MSNCFRKDKYNIIQRCLPFIIITSCGVVLVVRCFYSFCWSDEGFYLSLVHRFWVGDRPFVDEWSGTQLYAVILLPIYSLYRSLFGSSEGVYLFFRILMVVCDYLLSLYICATIRKKYDGVSSTAGALLFLFYTRANIQGASYYSVALFFFVWSICLVYNYKLGENNLIRMFMVGCNMAMATLANPYLALYYIIYGTALIFNVKYKKWRRDYLVVCTGTVFCACCYLVFILSRIRLHELLEYFPYIFGDPEHTGINLILSLILWFVRIIYRYIYTVPFWGLLLIYIIWSKWKKIEMYPEIRKKIVYLSFIIFGVNVFLSYDMIGCIDIALSILMLILYIIISEQKQKELDRVFYVFFLPGILFSIIWHMTSNTGLDSITLGFAVCAVIAPAVIREAYLELEADLCSKHRWLRLLSLVIVSVAILQTSYLRIFSVYRDDEIWKLDTKIENGPAKYLNTTEEHYRQYEEICDTLMADYENNSEDNTIVITELVPWAYLCIDKPYGSPSPCRFWGGLNEERLREYYTLMPDRIPAYILAVKPEYGNFKSSLIQGNEEAPIPNGTGVANWLLEKAEQLGYYEVETACGKIYVKP